MNSLFSKNVDTSPCSLFSTGSSSWLKVVWCTHTYNRYEIAIVSTIYGTNVIGSFLYPMVVTANNDILRFCCLLQVVHTWLIRNWTSKIPVVKRKCNSVIVVIAVIQVLISNQRLSTSVWRVQSVRQITSNPAKKESDLLAKAVHGSTQYSVMWIRKYKKRSIKPYSTQRVF